jgi:hypothetical protein
MTRYSLSPNCLFDRPWRPGHPFRPKTCRARKLGMGALLALLCLIIGGYGYLTDSDRVRAMAEGYLTGLVGGRVEVGGATLSIFEGLRLSDVKVYVDDPDATTLPSQPSDDGAGQGRAADSVLFSARSFLISYDPRSMLRGELQATQIVAEKPHVHLTQDVQTGAWNFARLGQSLRSRPQVPSSKPFKPSQLPELLLRDARVEISELRDGRSGSLGFIAIDGRLTPNGANRAQGYDFVLQSRGVSDATGPLASGSFDLASFHVSAQLGQFEFGRDIRSMLVSDVRQWTDRHELAGRVSIPVLDYRPGPPDASGQGGKPRFTVQMELVGVDLTVPAREWASPYETTRRNTSLEAVAAVQRANQIAGISGPGHGVGSLPADPKPSGTFPTTSPTVAALTSADTLQELLQPTPLQLRRMAGTFVFTEAGIAVKQVHGKVEGNGFNIDGHIDGYSPDAAMTLGISSLAKENLSIPASPRYVWSLPKDYREVYEHLRPQGSCTLQMSLIRPSPGAQIIVGGTVKIVNGQFVFNQFPYPLRNVNGTVKFGREHREGAGPDGWDIVRLVDLRGQGVIGGPNQDKYLTLNGWIGPVGPPGGPETGFDLFVHSDSIHSEPPLMQAFSPEVHQALNLFDAPGKGQFPQFQGAFTTHVLRKVGANQRITYDTDIHLVDATAAMVGFPYPARHVEASVQVRDGYVDVLSARMKRGNATVDLSGRVTWNDPDAGLVPTGPTALKVTVRNLPVDDDLLAALPADSAEWIRKTGVTGLLHIDGTLRAPPATIEHPGQAAQAPTTRPSGGLDYDLAILMHDGSVRPRNGEFLVSDVGGRMRLTRDKLDMLTVHGRRGDGTLSAQGSVTWTGDTPHLAFTVSGQNLLLEKSLYTLLPPAARDAWDELQPQGTLDAQVSYAPLDAIPAPGSTVRVDLTAAPVAVTTAPAAPAPAITDSGLPPGFRATLKPRALSATLRTIPFRLDQVGGAVEISPQGVVLRDITACHDKAKFTLSGTGAVGQSTTWDLKLTGQDVQPDAELHHALPAALTDLMDALKLKGKLGIRLDRFVYRPAPAAPSGAASATSGAEPEIDLRGALTLDGASLDVGVPVDSVKGTLAFDGTVRQGRLRSLTGSLDLASLRMADRMVSDLKANLLKPADRQELIIDGLQGMLGGGDLAGQASLLFPDDGPSRYVLSLVVRNADVKELAGETDQNLAGRLTASLALEGTWGKADARRGRGDVVVTGKELYRIPVVLGMLQITNLSLPVSSPFSSGIARYSVGGQKVTFEKIELRSKNMLMSGDGTLNFATRQVRMNFVTDNPGGFQVPIVQDLWRGAQHELLRIQVRGTVQEPKVQASSMGTLWTTVDEVLKGDAPEDGKSRKRRSTPE